MSDKMVAVMNKPKDCENCVFGVCKYSTPLSTRRKGYYCQLKEPKDRKVEDFSYEAEVHLENCPLISLEQRDKEIREKAIEEFGKQIKHWQDDIYDNERNPVVYDFVFDRIYEIAEQMKEVGE